MSVEGFLAFEKYEALGNDFVLVEETNVAITSALAAEISHRRTGVGCDQVMIVTKIGQTPGADCAIRIVNTDGAEAEACGNGTRCVARYLCERTGKSFLRMESAAGLLEAVVHGDDDVEVAQATPTLPLGDEPIDLSLECWPGAVGTAVDVGNPHLVVFVNETFLPDRLVELGPRLERHVSFPNRTNVEFVRVEKNGQGAEPPSLRMWVWERSAGVTGACGTGACAAAFAAVRRGFVVGPRVEVTMDLGRLVVTLRQDGIVAHRGPATFVFRGRYKLRRSND